MLLIWQITLTDFIFIYNGIQVQINFHGVGTKVLVLLEDQVWVCRSRKQWLLKINTTASVPFFGFCPVVTSCIECFQAVEFFLQFLHRSQCLSFPSNGPMRSRKNRLHMIGLNLKVIENILRGHPSPACTTAAYE